MGLTIHQEFEFNGTADEAKAKIVEVQRIAKDLPFKEVGKVWELDYSKGDFNNDRENKRCCQGDEEGYRWAKIQMRQDGKYVGDKRIDESEPDKFKGWVLYLWAGEGCEPTNIGLVSKDGEHWQGGSFTKTQYAKHFAKCHLLVVAILDVCKSLGILHKVSDEGDYWETRDLSKLSNNINESTAFIKQVGGMLSKVFPKDQTYSAIDHDANYMRVKKTVKNRMPK